MYFRKWQQPMGVLSPSNSQSAFPPSHNYSSESYLSTRKIMDGNLSSSSNKQQKFLRECSSQQVMYSTSVTAHQTCSLKAYKLRLQN